MQVMFQKFVKWIKMCFKKSKLNDLQSIMLIKLIDKSSYH